MADVRALLAAERASRQIKHPHLTYSKTGALSCNICNLNIKSEQLWPGHQKSPAHRKNVQRTSEQPIRPAKRKIESLEPEAEENNKKQKSFEDTSLRQHDDLVPGQLDIIRSVQQRTGEISHPSTRSTGDSTSVSIEMKEDAPVTTAPNVANVDEDEWAAFERDVAPLKQSNYNSATIEAAPLSAAELAEQQKVNSIQQREDEAEAEKEDESRRLEEEFEVMEEMENRVKRLRDRRDALRSASNIEQPIAKGQNLAEPDPLIIATDTQSSDDEDEDEWYN